MSYYEATANFFAEDFIPVPILNFRRVPDTPSSSLQCTCKSDEYYSRVYGSGLDSSQLTLRIICRSPSKYQEARDIETWWHTKYNTLRISLAAQQQMFFQLKAICECDPDMQSSTESITKSPERLSPDPARTASSSGSSANAPLRRVDSESKTNKKSAAARGAPEWTADSKPNTPKTETLSGTPVFRDSKEAHEAAALQDAERCHATNDKIVSTLRHKLARPYSSQSKGWIVVTESPTYPGYLSINFQAEGYPVIDEANLKGCLADRRLAVFTTVLPNVRRVLNLVLTELELFMCDMQCPSCATLHRDWYQIDVDTVQLIIMRWARWMSTAPYDRYDGLLNGEWFERTRYTVVEKICSTNLLEGGIDSQKTWGWWTRLGQHEYVAPSLHTDAVKLTRHFW